MSRSQPTFRRCLAFPAGSHGPPHQTGQAWRIADWPGANVLNFCATQFYKTPWQMAINTKTSLNLTITRPIYRVRFVGLTRRESVPNEARRPEMRHFPGFLRIFGQSSLVFLGRLFFNHRVTRVGTRVSGRTKHLFYTFTRRVPHDGKRRC